MMILFFLVLLCWSQNAQSAETTRSQELNFRIFDSKGDELTYGTLIDRLSPYKFVCIGEAHDSEATHRMQLRLIMTLHSLDPRIGVGMEMFQKTFQSALDKFNAGRIDEDTFLAETEYVKRWGHSWKQYRPIIEFCNRNDITVAALNAPAEITKRVSKVGVDGLTAAEKQLLGPIDFTWTKHREHWFELLAKMHGGTSSKERKEQSYQVMTIWDDYMARSAAAFAQDRKLERMIVLAGLGHVEYRFGVPDRLAKYSGSKVVSIAIAEATQSEDANNAKPDFTICVELLPLPRI